MTTTPEPRPAVAGAPEITDAYVQEMIEAATQVTGFRMASDRFRFVPAVLRADRARVAAVQDQLGEQEWLQQAEVVSLTRALAAVEARVAERDAEVSFSAETMRKALELKNEYRQRAENAEDDSLRLHREKMVWFDRTLILEGQLAVVSARASKAVEVLREIRDADWVENCLDPQWAARQARAALLTTDATTTRDGGGDE